MISEQIQVELRRHGVFDRIAATSGDRFVVANVTQPELDGQQAALSGFKVHQVDMSVAALAARVLPDVVLTDDLELRKGLETRGHTVVGSVGVLVRGSRAGRFTKAELLTHLDLLFNGSTLYLSKGFRAYVRIFLDNLTG
jgi:predicted nucleic acid-binding protein